MTEYKTSPCRNTSRSPYGYGITFVGMVSLTAVFDIDLKRSTNRFETKYVFHTMVKKIKENKDIMTLLKKNVLKYILSD